MKLLIGNYEIEIDRMNHTLYEKKVSKAEKDYRVAVGYYNNVEQAIEKIISNELADVDVSTTMTGYLEIYKEITSNVLKQLEKTLRGRRL